ncbi:MAG: M13 family metallopeptidase [Deltaproteobacteria bacterium]|nr:MAG: M13 family metallopeptidase [Deltaproteobacteria bacterium]TMQ04807.1 MAG: M13 family metallopeptidase [Deltaproteobacteria bacterium]
MRPVLAIAVAAACSGSSPASPTSPAAAPAPPAPPAAPAAMTLAQSGIVPDWIDTTAAPCTDFYAFACGGFLKTATIPPDRASWGAIEIVVKDGEDVLHQVLEAAARSPSGDPTLDKIGTYYAACTDEAAIERAGIAPMQPLLDIIARVVDARSAAAAIVALHAEGVFPLFAIAPQQDFGDATRVIASLDQAGLGLPDRSYYLESKGNMAKTRAAYVAHLGRLFQLLGRDHATEKAAAAAAAEAMRVETQIARLQQDQVVRRDPKAVYHRVDRAGLETKLAPSFPWSDYLAALGIPGVTAITVNDPAYYTAIARLLRTEEPAALRTYLTEVVMRDQSDNLGKAWVDEAFAMRKVLAGLKELPPRWLRCLRSVDRDLGELLGQSYVKARFAGDAKVRAVELTRSVLAAMRVELDQLSWMDDPTRAAAKQKLDRMAYLVGFPDRWRKYDFELRRTDFAGNVRAAGRFELARQLAKIGKPVDRFDWGMTPPTVNAYYDPTLNEIALPAGQLQPPFFGAAFHPAVNFGSTGGGTIGHEMTHGFDDEGSQFDADGNLREWWSVPTRAKFAEATQCVIDQYAHYEAVPGVHLDGKLTAGENIADNGGVKIAYQAYQTWKAQHKPPPPPAVDGYTDDQLYFLAYAQSWCDKMTPEVLETRAHSNPHSPPMWRVNGVIVNQPGFGPAFQCAAGTPMNPGKPCAVW